MKVQRSSEPLIFTSFRRRRERGAAQLIEFAVALLLFVSIFLLPSLFILRLTMGIALGQFATDKAAQVAASAAAYDVAQSKSQRLFVSTVAGAVGAMASLTPINGASGTGVDLYISVEDEKGKKEIYGPNRAMVRDIDPVNKRYFYTVLTHIEMVVLPGSDPHCPIVGFLAKPMVLNFQASCLCENPESLRIITAVAHPLSRRQLPSEANHES